MKRFLFEVDEVKHCDILLRNSFESLSGEPDLQNITYFDELALQSDNNIAQLKNRSLLYDVPEIGYEGETGCYGICSAETTATYSMMVYYYTATLTTCAFIMNNITKQIDQTTGITTHQIQASALYPDKKEVFIFTHESTTSEDS